MELNKNLHNCSHTSKLCAREGVISLWELFKVHGGDDADSWKEEMEV